ncbi:glutathione S-transferase family protein [Roseibium aestuarii]|uniref:Glutathione S-transferase family protein n=1 Tax=Roseibium aestuarii TaxID=2600299 RepID=A0ABW4JT54_9HYPH|nr:glutathione S-transferase [Roseibium aestuarii]
MSMKIWGRINSSNVRKVLWCAEELGLSYEQIDAGGAFGVVATPQYRALNPNGRIPCLQDGDFVLWESNAIVRYLARKYGKAPFVNETLEGWASADRWMDWMTFSFTVPFKDVFWNVVRTAPEKRDHAALEAGLAQCISHFALADEALSRQPYLSGDHLGIGDIPLGSIAYAWFEMPIERPAMPHLEAWYARLKERPAYRKGVMSPLT